MQTQGSTRQAPPSIPRINGYRVLEPLGQGGMGVVFRAEREDTGEEVALKTVRVARKQELMSLRREIHALTQLRHDAVVRFVDHGVEAGRPWYAMELLSGWTLGTLRDQLHRWRGDAHAFGDAPTQATPLSALSLGESFDAETAVVPDPRSLEQRPSIAEGLPRVLDVVARLCHALAYIHSRGIVHRDLKPSNIFLRADGTPVLVDFGLVSRHGGADGRLVLEAHDSGRGTPAYMAPEQIHGEAVDARADFYSLGCLLFELLTGQCPFEGETVFEVINHHLSTPPDPPSRWVDGVPEELDDLVLHLLAKRRRDRIGHAGDVLAVLRGLGVGAAQTVEVPRPILYRSLLVGRYAERSQLNGVLADASVGRGALMLIGGESGVGKTHLATAVTQVARKRSMRVITAECRREANAPLEAFLPVLQAVLDRCLEHGAAQTRRMLGVRGKVLAAFEPALGDLPGVRELPDPTRLPPDAERERVLTVFEEVLSAFVQEVPLLLIIDDLQWGDDLSLSMMRELQGRGFFEARGMVLLGTYRSDEVEAPLEALRATSGVRHLHLERLGDEEIGAMVGDMLAMREAPASLVGYLARQSEGNPFFVAEYLRAAVTERLLSRERGRWRVGDESGDGWARLGEGLPRTLRDLMLRRLDALEPLARRLAAVAAIVGREASMELIFRAAQLDEQAGFEALSALYARQVLEPGQGGHVRFVHHKLAEAAAADLSPAEQARLHGAVAEATEAIYRGLPGFELRFANLAMHWRKAEQLPQAITYLELAGAYAVRIAAHADALGWLQEAARLRAEVGQTPDRLRAATHERLLGECCLGLGDIAKARQHLYAAAALLGWAVPEENGPAALALLGEVAMQAVHRTIPSAFVPSSHSVAALTEGARTFEVMQTVARSTNRAVLILLSALRALNLAELGASEVHRANGYALAQVIAGTIPWVGLAERYGALARRALRGCDDRAATVWVDQMAAVYHTSRGQLLAAADEAHRAAALAEEIGFRSRWEESSVAAAYAETYLGRLQPALKRYDAVARSARRGALRHLAWALAGGGRIRIFCGEDEAARESYEELLALPTHSMDPLDRLIVELTGGWGLMQLGEVDRAMRLLEAATDALREVPPSVIEISGVVADAADFWSQRWRSLPPGREARHAQARFKEVLGVLRRFGRSFVVLETDVLFGSGELAWMQGDRRGAAQGYRQSAARAQELGMPIHEAKALGSLAQLEGEGAREARARMEELLRAAGVRFERIIKAGGAVA